MEIKVGEYVRFKNGLIDKVTECRYAEDYKKNFSLDNKLMKYERNKYWFKNRGGSWTDITFKKHSYNIIDLIEERRLCEWGKDRKNKKNRRKIIY